MKKIDKLILSSFIGPFFLTFLVVVFILLTQHMLKYFDDIVGKDLGIEVLSQLLFYFAIFMTPIAIPLAVLLSSLMTFGNLGEHFELTAIKSAGISLLRALLPIFVFVLGLTVLAFYSNNYFVPKAALEAYSLLYDIKQKKPALDLKEGAFYSGIPNFSIKVNKKHSDGRTIEDVIIYDHREASGNKNVTLADSGAMYTIHDERYLKLELFDGHTYAEGSAAGSQVTGVKGKKETFRRAKFKRSEFVLDLSSFGLDRTDKSLFEGNRIMRNLSQLEGDVDSVTTEILEKKLQVFSESAFAFYYHLRDDSIAMSNDLEVYKAYKDSLRAEKQRQKQIRLKEKNDSIKATKKVLDVESLKENSVKGSKAMLGKPKQEIEAKKKTPAQKIAKAKPKISRTKIKKDIIATVEADTTVQKDTVKTKTKADIVADLMADSTDVQRTLQSSLNMARQVKSKLLTNNTRIERLQYVRNVYEIQWHKILANSVACIVMFLIGAPLGAIIKKGGLGIPVLISIIFFIIFYVISMTGEKWAKQGLTDPILAMWAANAILLPIGLFFLRQARNDARLFETDFYNVMIDKAKTWFKKQRKKTNQDSI
ncbi:MAG: LptF/LptG family permease [Fulvivirga sp.]